MSEGKVFDSRLFAKKFVNEGREPVTPQVKFRPMVEIKEAPEEREEDTTSENTPK